LAFSAATRISRVNCAEMAEDELGQLAHEIFSIERTFLTSEFRPLRFKESSVGRPQILVFLQVVLLFYCTLYTIAQVTYYSIALNVSDSFF